MLEKIQDIPERVMGLRAKGQITKEDYQKTVVPYFEEARLKGDRMRFLYHFGPEFEGFGAIAAWEDIRVDLKYIRRFERCAVVSDSGWIQNMTRGFSVTLPCPVRVFENAGYDDAVKWLNEPAESSLDYTIMPEKKIVVLEWKGKLRAEDVDALTSSVDTWIEGAGRSLQGLVLFVHEPTEWQNFESLVNHISFVKNHHRQIRRVALVTNHELASIVPAFAQHFVSATVEQFEENDKSAAISWASDEISGYND